MYEVSRYEYHHGDKGGRGFLDERLAMWPTVRVGRAEALRQAASDDAAEGSANAETQVRDRPTAAADCKKTRKKDGRAREGESPRVQGRERVLFIKHHS